MSPDPFHAVQNAIEHYRIDEVLISTFAGESSRWLEEDLIGRVREITEKPVEHIEVGRPAAAVAAAVAEGEAELMESATVALGHGHAEEHHGPPEANQSSRIDRQTLGILLFIVSEVMLFGAFFASYFFLRVVVNPPAWPPHPYELPVAVAGVNTGDPRLLQLHDPLRAGVDPARQPQRPETRPGPDLDARRDLPLHPDQRVRRTSASAPATSPSARSSTASPACTAPTSSSA